MSEINDQHQVWFESRQKCNGNVYNYQIDFGNDDLNRSKTLDCFNRFTSGTTRGLGVLAPLPDYDLALPKIFLTNKS